MKSQISNDSSNQFTHILLQFHLPCQHDDDDDWSYRLHGVHDEHDEHGAHHPQKVLLCQSSTPLAAAAANSSRSLFISTATDPATLQEVAIPTLHPLNQSTLDAPITCISTDTYDSYIAAATTTNIHILSRDLHLLHTLESPAPHIHSLCQRYLAYIHPHPTSTSGIIAANNLNYADRPSYSTAEIASHLASYIEAGYKRGHNTFDSLRNTYYSRSAPVPSESVSASPQSHSQAQVQFQDLYRHSKHTHVVRVLDIPTQRTVGLFDSSLSPLSHISLSPSSRNVLVADTNAHVFHIYELRPRPLIGVHMRENDSDYDCVWHRYALRRGYTTARVQNVSWSRNERWVGVTTHTGTTHVYPLNPNSGGRVTEAHVSGEPISMGAVSSHSHSHSHLSTTLNSIVKIRPSGSDEGDRQRWHTMHTMHSTHSAHSTRSPYDVAFAFADVHTPAKGSLVVYVADSARDKFAQLDYTLSWSEGGDLSEKQMQTQKKPPSVHAALGKVCDVVTQEESNGTSKEQHISHTISHPSNPPPICQMSRGEIETFDVSALRSIFSSRQIEFRAASTDILARYADDATELIRHSYVYRVRPEVEVRKEREKANDDEKKDSNDNDIEKDIESTIEYTIDPSSIHHIIPALPNGVNYKSSLSLPDQHTLRKIIKGSYSRISSTFGSPEAVAGGDTEDNDTASVEGDVRVYKEAKEASEEADRFVVGLVDDEEEGEGE
ncbi:Breast carcinoma-amplified sequence 3-like protein [Wallemia ichthyophaga EXF-994]|uniref:Breast carcinoma-amplified sequence 3-like protein n=1 Tax=Wallemia ichthyophaga (strain EXF-994 / CBS 113033) TaxID=1299270 RepID=R9AI33_WALI9|nr:Breast carcinoma-amplified sequence 3-like protein [Wallemia ichthyophaga EXF-994]EOR01872.1 Breast carcinoma-amplified sequence 3-like protein [Wallemia ichthyophaga EXF-994]